MRLCAIIAACLVWSGTALAQNGTVNPLGWVLTSPLANSPGTSPGNPIYTNGPGGTGGGGGTTAPYPATTTQTGGTLNATVGTFNRILAAATTTRNGCTFQNTSSAPELAYFGTSQTPSAANSLSVPAGGTVSCSAGLVVLQDALFVASPTIPNATYVIATQ